MKELSTLLAPFGFALDDQQPYMSGERYLAVGVAGGTFVLAGTEVATGAKVIIKASRAPHGKKEIESEKKARDLMRSLAFANKKIKLPEERYYGTRGEYTILIMSFIPQEKVFVAHTIEEQFFIALSAFEAQESFHATTYGHLRAIQEVFPMLSATEYLRDFARLQQSILKVCPDESTREVLKKTETFLTDNRTTIDRYVNYLTHTDFVPHNFRLMEHALYMLDCVPNYATIHFGNKYEGWARFLNYMMLHSPELERLLLQYVRDNRGEDEYLSLRLMRAYKLTFLLNFYAESLAKTTGDLNTLTLARLIYWREALAAILEDRPLAEKVTRHYKETRDTLRTEEEKARQREFAIA